VDLGRRADPVAQAAIGFELTAEQRAFKTRKLSRWRGVRGKEGVVLGPRWNVFGQAYLGRADADDSRRSLRSDRDLQTRRAGFAAAARASCGHERSAIPEARATVPSTG